MTYKEAYKKVSVAVAEAEDEYFGRTLSKDDKKWLDDWDKALDVVEKATKIAEALTNLIADMEAKDTWSCHINDLKKIVEEAE